MILQTKINDLRKSRNVVLTPKVREDKSAVIAFPNCLFWDEKLDMALMIKHGRTLMKFRGFWLMPAGCLGCTLQPAPAQGSCP